MNIAIIVSVRIQLIEQKQQKEKKLDDDSGTGPSRGKRLMMVGGNAKLLVSSNPSLDP